MNTFTEYLKPGAAIMAIYQTAIDEGIKIINGSLERLIVVHYGELITVHAENGKLTHYTVSQLTDDINENNVELLDADFAEPVRKDRVLKVLRVNGLFLEARVKGEPETVNLVAYKTA